MFERRAFKRPGELVIYFNLVSLLYSLYIFINSYAVEKKVQDIHIATGNTNAGVHDSWSL